MDNKYLELYQKYYRKEITLEQLLKECGQKEETYDPMKEQVLDMFGGKEENG